MTADQEFRETARRFTELADAVPDDATWERRSPVPEWTARDVVGHLVGWFPPFLAGGAGIHLPSGPPVDEDPAGAWRTLSDAVQALLDDPATAGRELVNPHIGTVPLPEAVSRFFTTDVFLHTWDLARATGQDDRLDPDRCAAVLAGMLPMDEMLRASGQFGPKVDPGPDAGPVSRLMAFIGREVATPGEQKRPS